jgi:hypothetical protein
VVDSPGLNSGARSDLNFIRDIVQQIKDSNEHINLFPIVINGQTRAGAKSTLDALGIFEEIFSGSFWRNACIVVTHFSRNPMAEAIRIEQGVTKDSKKAEILEVINERFWHSQEKNLRIPVYFVDAFDMDKEYDKEKTQDELRRMVRLAKDNTPFATKNMRKCMSVKWRDYKDRIITIHLDMLQKEFINGFHGLGPEELNFFERRSGEIM